MKSLQVDPENNAETWWEAALAAKDPPKCFAALVRDHRVEVSNKDAKAFIAWASALPGWADGPSFARYAVNVHDVK